VQCIDLDQDTGRWCALVHTDSIKAGNFLTEFLRKDTAPCSYL